ncbi:capsular polysaccharide synthesis protein [Vagococcus carniphilus]|uniref:capsular polysaccharide synthesis protein n=1 Tax=Vagococcus carniphilus TaxID=218144 RepID=UPI003BAB84A8
MGFKNSLIDYRDNKKEFGLDIAKSKLICRILFSIDKKFNWNLPFKKYWIKNFETKEKLVLEYLEENYNYILNEYINSCLNTDKLEDSNKVWVCWFQGMENAPYNVKLCYEALKLNFENKDIVVIDETNIKEYVHIPNQIFTLWKSGRISNQLFSDIVRTDLLFYHGGYWVDATCLFFKKLPEMDSKFSVFYAKNLIDFPSDYNYIDIKKWEAYFIYSKKNNLFFKYLNDCLIEYSLNNKLLIEYLLMNYFAKIGRENVIYFNTQDKMVPTNNTQCEILKRSLNSHRDEFEISEDTYFVKLSSNEVYSSNKDSLFNKLLQKNKLNNEMENL